MFTTHKENFCNKKSCIVNFHQTVFLPRTTTLINLSSGLLDFEVEKIMFEEKENI